MEACGGVEQNSDKEKLFIQRCSQRDYIANILSVTALKGQNISQIC